MTVKSAASATFSSLSNRNYRLYWCAMCCSSIAIWMQNASQSWLSYSTTNSAFLLGLVGSAQYLPILCLSLFTGILLDRISKKRAILCCQSLLACFSLVMFLLVVTGTVRFWHIAALAFATGLVNVFNIPLRQTIINEVVDGPHIMNAVALFNMVFNLARIVGPTAAGFLMDSLGVGACFLLNTGLFLGSTLLLSRIRVPGRPAAPQPSLPRLRLSDIREEFTYLGGKPTSLDIIVSMALIGILALNFQVQLPLVAATVMGQGASGYGTLVGCVGIGSFISSTVVASRGSRGPNRKILFSMPILLALVQFLLGACKTGWTLYPSLVLLGFFYLVFASYAATTLQLETDAAHLGQVMSIYNLVLAGATPVGNMLVGTISEKWNVGVSFFVCGALMLLLYGAYWAIARQKRGKGNRPSAQLNGSQEK